MGTSALLLLILLHSTGALLRVQQNELREYDLLDGLWSFVREPMNGGDIGIPQMWQLNDLSKFSNASVMPVPSAYNDMEMSAELRDHVGWVWYQTKHFLPIRDDDRKLVLRFGSVNYYCNVYVNGKQVGSHVGGHLPFEFDVTGRIKPGKLNTITVAVNNTLSWATVPQADFNYQDLGVTNLTNGSIIQRLPEGAFKMTGLFDFFHYAGILRSVHLVKLPPSHIQDIVINAEHQGSFAFEVITSRNATTEEVLVNIYDSDGNEVFSTKGRQAISEIKNVKPWWPRGMGDPNLYEFKATLIRTTDNTLLDVYRLPFGFRTVSWTDHQILINDKPFYCLGFGMHEDSNIRGRGFDPVVMTKDLNLLEWTGGNCYRTSHYPYSEERMYENDRRGIAVVVETPAVGLKGFPKANQLIHMKYLEDMIGRDRNHPSIFMWSIANEPHSEKKESRNYFKGLIDHAHSLDKTRPVTIVYGPSDFTNDQSADLLDIVCVNRYYGWYRDLGALAWINQSVYWDITRWKDTFKKPIIVTEYGADSLPGLNQEPSINFSEQYQRDILLQTHIAFDRLRKDHILAGEMIWNFADFMTAMTKERAVGNHKGIFTRDRQAKQAAYVLRERYLARLNQTNDDVW